MNTDLETVSRMAHLARLEFSAEELQNLSSDLNAVLDWMNTLNQLDTQGVEPLIHIGMHVQSLREDTAQVTFTHQQALANAPKKDSDYFRVPKFVE